MSTEFPLLDLPSNVHEFVAEHMQTDPKSLSNLQQTRKIFRDSSYYKNAMQKKLERSCLAAIKEPTGWGIAASNNICTTPSGYEFNRACREKTKICSKIYIPPSEAIQIHNLRVDIPRGTVMIGRRAFARFLNLQEITIPNTVTNIGLWAFAGCEFLKKVVLPESVEIIQSNAFAYCERLEEVVISKDIRHIGEDAFRGCRKLNLIFQNNVPHLNRINPVDIGADGLKRITFRINFSDPGLCPFEITGLPVLPTSIIHRVKIAIEPAI